MKQLSKVSKSLPRPRHVKAAVPTKVKAKAGDLRKLNDVISGIKKHADGIKKYARMASFKFVKASGYKLVEQSGKKIRVYTKGDEAAVSFRATYPKDASDLLFDKAIVEASKCEIVSLSFIPLT
jgi:hypothetical protein